MQSGAVAEGRERAAALEAKGDHSRAVGLRLGSRRPSSQAKNEGLSEKKALSGESDGDFTLFRFPLERFPEADESSDITPHRHIA